MQHHSNQKQLIRYQAQQTHPISNLEVAGAVVVSVGNSDSEREQSQSLSGYPRSGLKMLFSLSGIAMVILSGCVGWYLNAANSKLAIDRAKTRAADAERKLADKQTAINKCVEILGK